MWPAYASSASSCAVLALVVTLCAADGGGAAAPGGGSSFERRLRAKLEAAFLGPDGVLNRSVPEGGPDGGFWLAFHNGSEQFTVALGSSNGLDPAAAEGRAAAASDIIPAGSLAKPFTATAVMRLVEAGVVGLDDAIPQHVDPFLTRINGTNTTLEALWGATINNVTIRMLLNMRSGLAEYDDQQIRRETIDFPDWDISPQDYLAGTVVPKQFSFPPGTKSNYNSIGYMLLALVLATHARRPDGSELTDWAQLDQRSAAIPAALLAQGKYRSTTFFTRGRCSAYPHVAHYFACGNKTDPAHVDMFERSCLNGFGFGNLGISAGDAASFFYDLLGPEPRIVGGRARMLMSQFTGWGTTDDIVGEGHHYGLGLWTDPILTLPRMLNTSIAGMWPHTSYIGHGGADYGTYMTAGIHPLGFGFAIGQNLCTDPVPANVMMCEGWKAIWEVMDLPGGAAAFNCSHR